MDTQITIDFTEIKMHFEAQNVSKSKFGEKISEIAKQRYEHNFGKPLTRSKDVSDFVLYIYPQCQDEELMENLALIYFHLFILDDHLEKIPTEFRHWSEIYERKIEPNMNSPLEKFWCEIIAIVESCFTDLQKEKYFNSLTKYCNCNEIHTESGVEKKNNLTNDSYFKLRYYEGAVSTMHIYLEVVLKIDMDYELLGNELMIEFHQLFSNLIALQNDVLSFKKEMFDNHKFNYVFIRSRNNNISLQESMNLMVDDINETYEQFLLCKKKIIESLPSVDIRYLDGMQIMVLGHWNWTGNNARFTLDSN